jgi:hypothetical protein
MRFFTNPRRFYWGTDLHARTMHVCVLDHEGTVVLDRNLLCHFPSLLEAIAPFRDGIVIGVEWMFGWYWLADRCAEHNIPYVVGHALCTTHPCATDPDLDRLEGPLARLGLIQHNRSDLTILPWGCPRVELTLNEDACLQRDLDALKSRRGERMVFEGASECACSRQIEANSNGLGFIFDGLVRRPTNRAGGDTKVENETWPLFTFRVTGVDSACVDPMHVGGELLVKARVELGPLSPDDVQVQLFHGLVDSMAEIPRPSIVLMCADGKGAEGAGWLFQGAIPCDSSGQHGYTVRILPRHADLANPFEPGLVCWG